MAKIRIALALGIGLGVLSSAHALTDSEEIIKFRQSVMAAIGGHMGALNRIVRDKVDFKDQLVTHAEPIAALSKDVIALFPPDSDFGETRALPEVWSKRQQFEQSAKDLEKAAQAFLEASKQGDKSALMSSYKDLGDTCKGCHEDFREEE